MQETRFPYLFAILTGEDADAEEKRRAAFIRECALKDLQEAQRRRDTRKEHERAKKAVQATCEALRAGA